MHLRRFPTADVASQMLITELDRNVRRLFDARTDSVHFALTDDGLWFEGDLLLHETLEYADLGRQVGARGIETISIDRDHSRLSTVALAQFIAGTSGDLPEGEGIRLNDVPVPAPIEPGSRGPGLRRAYLAAIEVLRSAVFAARTGEEVDIEKVQWAADRLVVASDGRPTAAALLATMQNPTDYLFHHSVNTALLSIEMARAAGMGAAALRVVGVGALLHDLGKVIVVPDVMDDPGALDEAAWQRLRQYPVASAASILGSGVPGAEVASIMALEHSVRFDGTGYPTLPAGHRIHPSAALLAVVDVYEAVTARRPYRRAETNGNAVRILRAGAGTQFAPDMVKLFIERFGPIPPGSCFRVSSGEVLLGVRAEDGTISGLMVEDGNGDLLAVPEPARISLSNIDGELSVLETAVRPAAYLDQVEGMEQRVDGRSTGGGR